MIHSIHSVNLRSVDLNLLVVFDALMTEHSVSRAARRIGLSQPATSNALARLRDVFDDRLFVRRGSEMVPTPRAEVIAGHVRAGLGHLDLALGPPRGFDPATAQRELVIATADYASLVILPDLMRRIRTQAPGIDVKVVPYGPVVPFDGLARGDVDLVVGSPRNVPPGVAVGDLFEDRFTCLVRKDHPKVGRRLTLARFVELDHLLVAPLGGKRGFVDRALGALDRRRRIALRVPDFLLAPFIVAATDLVVTLPTGVAAVLGERLELRRLAPPVEIPSFSYALLWDERRNDDPALQWLRECVSEAAKRGARRRT